MGGFMWTVERARSLDCWSKLVSNANHSHVARTAAMLDCSRDEARRLHADIRASEGAILDTPQRTRSAPPAYRGPRTHLIIPDTHVEKGQCLERFDWLAQLIGERQPDVIVHLGDYSNCSSLSVHNKALDAWGKCYADDLKAVHESLDYLAERISHYTVGGYDPLKVLVMGNHDNYPNRLVKDHPQLQGRVGNGDWEFERFFDEVHPFLTPRVIDGVLYQHCIAGATGRPKGGKTLAPSLLRDMHGSVVVGHAHTKQYAEATVISDGRKMLSLVGGCFFPKEPMPGYMTRTGAQEWWHGVHLLHDVQDGYGDLESISLDRLERLYG